MSQPARIIFAGSPEFAVPPLQALIESPHEVVAVLTQPDRPSGRGRKLTPGPVKQAALDAGLPVLQPLTLKEAAAQQQVAEQNADLMVVVAYGLLLPSAVLAMPERGCINLHASLLPRWRGASPMQMAILHGDAQTGINIMQMDVGLDTGDVLATATVDIGARETVAELHDRLALLGARLLADNLAAILADELEPVSQPDAGATYAHRIKKADGLIDWSQSAVDIDRKIRAYAGWPVAHTLYEGEPLRCWASDVIESAAAALAPGVVIAADSAGLQVQTGAGVLLLTSVQLAGRKRVSAQDFANAHDASGVVLGR